MRRPSYAFMHRMVDGSDEIVPCFVRAARTDFKATVSKKSVFVSYYKI